MARQFVEASSQYAQAPDNVTTNPATSAMSIVAWVRFPVTPSNDRPIINKREGWDAGPGFELKNNKDGKIRFDVQGIGQARLRAEGTVVNLFNGNWHLLIGDRTPGTAITGLVNLYGDDVLLDSTAGANNDLTNSDPLWIAAADTGHPAQVPGRFLDAVIAEVALFFRVLDPVERTALFLGYSPEFFRPTFHTRLIGNLSPEPDFAGGNLVTLFNAPTKATHKDIIHRWQMPDGLDLKITPVAISAAIAANSTATASLGAGVPVSSTTASNTTASAIIKKETPLSADLDAVSVGTADLSGLLRIAGTASTNSTASGSLGAETPLSAIGPTQSAATGSLDAGVPLQALMGSASGTAADLTRGRSFSSTLAGSSVGLATLDADRGLAGDAASNSSANATLNAEFALSGSTDSESEASANLNYGAALAGVSASATGAVGALDAGTPLTAIGSSTSTAQGFLTRPQALSTVAASTSAAGASLTATVGIDGLASSDSNAIADLGVDKKLAGLASSVSSLSGRLRLPGEVLTTSAAGRIVASELVGGTITASDLVGGVFRKVQP